MSSIRRDLLQREFPWAQGHWLAAAASVTLVRPTTGSPTPRLERPRSGKQTAPFKKARVKNAKSKMTICATDKMPGGYWSDRGYNWFRGS